MRIQAKLLHVRFVESIALKCNPNEIEIGRCFALSCDFSGQVWLVLVSPACFGGHYGNGRSSIPSKSSLPSPMGPRLTLAEDGDERDRKVSQNHYF